MLTVKSNTIGTLKETVPFVKANKPVVDGDHWTIALASSGDITDNIVDLHVAVGDSN
jgi:enolase